MRFLPHPGGVRLDIKVVPGASRDEIAGWLGDRLKIRVAAPPQAGKANQAVRRIIADALGVPFRRVTIIAGDVSPQKTVLIAELTPDEAAERLMR